MTALTATGVTRTYGTRTVLKDLKLTVPAGAFAALMGPSGSGKSTFLHLAAGLLTADAGEIVVGDMTITQLDDSAAARFRRRHIGVVFQAFNLLNERTVAENILMPLTLEGTAKTPDAQARLAHLATRLGLTDHLNKKPEELSGGEQQRVALARALMARPAILLADEPTGNLDASNAKEICRLLKELNEEEKVAILVVTHDPMVAVCAEVVHFLKDGQLKRTVETQGNPERISQLYVETYA